MARAQIERWAAEHPTAPRIGRFFEVPQSYVLPRVFLGLAAAGALCVLNYKLYYKTPVTLEADFEKEVAKLGKNVAPRLNASPVFLNPFRNGIKDGVLGPEELKA